MKYIIIFLILFSIIYLQGNCQTNGSKQDSTVANLTTVNWDTLGMALLKGLEYKELYFNEVLLTKVLKYEIDLHKEKYSNILLTVERLAEQISKQPTFISSHDWKITILITGLTTILTVIFMLQFSK